MEVAALVLQRELPPSETSLPGRLSLWVTKSKKGSGCSHMLNSYSMLVQ